MWGKKRFYHCSTIKQDSRGRAQEHIIRRGMPRGLIVTESTVFIDFLHCNKVVMSLLNIFDY